MFKPIISGWPKYIDINMLRGKSVWNFNSRCLSTETLNIKKIKTFVLNIYCLFKLKSILILYTTQHTVFQRFAQIIQMTSENLIYPLNNIKLVKIESLNVSSHEWRFSRKGHWDNRIVSQMEIRFTLFPFHTQNIIKKKLRTHSEYWNNTRSSVTNPNTSHHKLKRQNRTGISLF